MEIERAQAQTNPAAAQAAKPGNSNLVLRIVSAVLLAAVALAALYTGFPFWPLLVLVVAMGLGWEWNRMLSRSGTAAALVLLSALALVIGLSTFGQLAIAGIVAVAGAVVLAIAGSGEGRLTHAAGLLYFGLPSIALLWLRADEPAGLRALLFVMIVVWVTDSAAYFVGRSVGGPKLWPAVSPNKTWSGSFGGAAAGVLAGILFAIAIGVQQLVWIGLLALALSLACQVGDLMESALKRRFDRKDSSGLIPGHGGLMDRLDGLLMSVLAAALLGFLSDPGHPSSALLPGLSP